MKNKRNKGTKKPKIKTGKHYKYVRVLEIKIQSKLDIAQLKGNKADIKELNFIRMRLAELTKDFLTTFEFPF